MKVKIKEYFEALKKLYSNIIVTGAGYKECQLCEGLDRAIDMIIKRAASGSKLLFIGNGASASISSHMAVDFWKNAGIKAVSFNDTALLTCLSNDYGYRHVFEKPIEVFGDPGDLLIAISSSGKSENILRAATAAKDKGIELITLSGFTRGNFLRKMGDLNFYVASSEYGFIEIAHTAICHCLVDMVKDCRRKPTKKYSIR